MCIRDRCSRGGHFLILAVVQILLQVADGLLCVLQCAILACGFGFHRTDGGVQGCNLVCVAATVGIVVLTVAVLEVINDTCGDFPSCLVGMEVDIVFSKLGYIP